MSRFRNIFGFGVLLAAVCLTGAGCRRDMQDQPKMKPYRSTSFFGDGLSSRPPVEGSIPRGYLRADTEFYTGKKSKSASSATSVSPAAPVSTASPNTNPYPDDLDTFPFPITEDTVKRGRERYQIFCSVCH